MRISIHIYRDIYTIRRYRQMLLQKTGRSRYSLCEFLSLTRSLSLAFTGFWLRSFLHTTGNSLLPPRSLLFCPPTDLQARKDNEMAREIYPDVSPSLRFLPVKRNPAAACRFASCVLECLLRIVKANPVMLSPLIARLIPNLKPFWI